MAIALTENTALAPQEYECQLLVRFESGEISIDQLEELLALART